MAKDNVFKITKEVRDEFMLKKLSDDVKVLDIELEDTQMGDVEIGVLTPDEASMFASLLMLEDEIEGYEFDKDIELKKRRLDVMQEQGHKDVNVRDVIMTTTLTDEEAEHLLELKFRHEYANALFWYSLRERLGAFSASLSVRKGFVVVRIGWKHKPDNK